MRIVNQTQGTEGGVTYHPQTCRRHSLLPIDFHVLLELHTRRWSESPASISPKAQSTAAVKLSLASKYLGKLF